LKTLWTAAAFFLALTALPLHAESKNPADYPFRIHIFGRNQTTFYHGRFDSIDETKGEGRANLFANGNVRGVDFNYTCSQKLVPSFGAETYPARWKKPGRELVVLFPVFGKAGSYWTCDLNTDVKDYAYYRSRGSLSSESPADFKAWMIQHDYDPEHGKDTPIRIQAPAHPAPYPPAAPSQQ
jgi:hypothetical protein